MEKSIRIPSLVLGAFAATLRQWRVTSIVYCIQLALALTLGMQVYEVLQASIGNSLEISRLMAHYDHTVLTDFLKVHGASITPLIGQLRWVLLVWLVFSVFIHAGLLFCATQTAARPRQFWAGGSTYFFPFLKISGIFALLFLLWTAFVLTPIALFFQDSLQYFSNEKYTVWWVLASMGVYFMGLAGLLAWSVASRLVYLSEAASIRKSIGTGVRMLRLNTKKVLILVLFFALLQLLTMLIYNGLDAVIGMTSPITIGLLFGIQQGFVFCRIQLRQMLYGAFFGISSPA